ncbi:hypothetical protein SNE40_017268 [Patella caerulea]|uniref:Uncharacterized protein n=1 Tax=Patella caerulea TaxID=87958 RepID=A0AAN8P9F4_PATCE
MSDYSTKLFNAESMSLKISQQNSGKMSSPVTIESSMKFIQQPLNQPSIKKTTTECMCERHMRNILCRACGFVFYGRIRQACPLHPNVIHLMDCQCCPKCRAGLLQEFAN